MPELVSPKLASLDVASRSQPVAPSFLREIQIEPWLSCHNYFTHSQTNPAHCFLKLPTRMGKTFVAAALIESLQSKKTLFLVPYRHNLQTVYEELSAALPNKTISIYGDGQSNTDGAVVVATYAGLGRNIEHFKQANFDFTIADELHLSLGIKRSEALRAMIADQRCLGMSAIRGYDSTRQFTQIVPTCAYSKSLLDAIDERALSRPTPLTIELPVDLDRVPIIDGDFLGAKLEQAVSIPIVYETIKSLCLDMFSDQQGFIFCAGKTHADNMAIFLNASGIAAESVHYERSRNERKDIIARFERGELKVLCGIDALAHGVGAENLSYIINFPTMSVVRAEERGGRPLSLAADLSQRDVTIVDLLPLYGRKAQLAVTFSDILGEKFLKSVNWNTPLIQRIATLQGNVLKPSDASTDKPIKLKTTQAAASTYAEATIQRTVQKAAWQATVTNLPRLRDITGRLGISVASLSEIYGENWLLGLEQRKLIRIDPVYTTKATYYYASLELESELKLQLGIPRKILLVGNRKAELKWDSELGWPLYPHVSSHNLNRRFNAESDSDDAVSFRLDSVTSSYQERNHLTSSLRIMLSRLACDSTELDHQKLITLLLDSKNADLKHLYSQIFDYYSPELYQLAQHFQPAFEKAGAGALPLSKILDHTLVAFADALVQGKTFNNRASLIADTVRNLKLCLKSTYQHQTFDVFENSSTNGTNPIINHNRHFPFAKNWQELKTLLTLVYPELPTDRVVGILALSNEGKTDREISELIGKEYSATRIAQIRKQCLFTLRHYFETQTLAHLESSWVFELAYPKKRANLIPTTLVGDIADNKKPLKVLHDSEQQRILARENIFTYNPDVFFGRSPSLIAETEISRADRFLRLRQKVDPCYDSERTRLEIDISAAQIELRKVLGVLFFQDEKKINQVKKSLGEHLERYSISEYDRKTEFEQEFGQYDSHCMARLVISCYRRLIQKAQSEFAANLPNEIDEMVIRLSSPDTKEPQLAACKTVVKRLLLDAQHDPILHKAILPVLPRELRGSNSADQSDQVAAVLGIINLGFSQFNNLVKPTWLETPRYISEQIEAAQQRQRDLRLQTSAPKIDL